MGVASASTFGIPRADIDVTDVLTKLPFRNACRVVYRISFPAHVG